MKKIALLGILFLFVVSALAAYDQTAQQSNVQTEPAADVTMVVGSPLILSGETVKRLDTDNPDIAPKVQQSRTLVPLRALTQNFGAEVTYDEKTEEATILYNGKQAVFKADRLSFTFDKKEVPLDVPARVYDGRMLVPLRAVAETVLEKVVSYDSSGIIYIGGSQKDIANDKAFKETAIKKIGQARRPQSIEQLKNMLLTNSNVLANSDKTKAVNGAATVNDAAAPIAVPQAAAASTDEKADFSQTNIQVEGIDEADIVKTDGKNLFVAANRTVYLVSASGSDMKIASKITLDDNRSISEMYAANNQLVVIGQKYDNGGDVHIMNDKKMLTSIAIYPYNNKNTVFAFVYDVTDPSAPKKVREFEVEGNLSSSRKNGDSLYVIANKNVYGVAIENAKPEDIMPMYKDGAGEEKPVGIDRVICPPIVESPSYATIAALDLSDLDQPLEIESILGASNQLYMNVNSLYLTRAEYKGDGEQTVITKFSIDGTKIGYSASNAVSGRMQDQFWMDEENGYLRVATTDSAKGSNLFVLDESLNPVGQITGIAKGEQIYSVRFIGNAGYIVTFRTMDPLFAIDLSDPKNPVIKGELKIPGFSDYLHPVGENLLLGIGRDTKDLFIKDKNGKETVVGTYQGGIKLSLFDVSDMTKPVEKDVLVLGGQGSSTDVMYNHKAIMTDAANNVIGFDATLYDDTTRAMSFSGSMLIRISADGLFEKGRIDATPEQGYSGDVPYLRRLLYIGNTLYYLQDGKVRAFDYTTLQEQNSLTLA